MNFMVDLMLQLRELSWQITVTDVDTSYLREFIVVLFNLGTLLNFISFVVLVIAI